MEECVKTAIAAIHVNVNKAFMDGTALTVGLYYKTIYYCCGFSVATIEYSSPSVCVSVCVCVCFSVYLSVYTITRKIIGQST